MAGLNGTLGRTRTRAPRPFRMLPRPAAAALLALIACALAWSAWSVGYDTHLLAKPNKVAQSAGRKSGDLALYARINARMAAGEGYYSAALAEQRASGYPTIPSVTVRTPVMAWGTKLFGQRGWRVVAIVLLVAGALAIPGALARCANMTERIGAALLLLGSGTGVFYLQIGLLHDLMAGLCLSCALLFYRRDRWWPSLLVLAAGLAIRELAVPFALLWLAFALVQRRRGEAIGVALVLALFAIGMGFHAQAVIAHRLPGDAQSPGWHGLLGPGIFLSGLAELTPLLELPRALAGPLALLPLVGWVGLGGRAGAFASLWFAGFALAMALFARANTFYWVMLVLPAYAAGLALVPRALTDLVAAMRGQDGLRAGGLRAT